MRKLLIIALAALIPSVAFAQAPKLKPLTGDLIKDIKGGLGTNSQQSGSTSGGDVCDFNVLASLKASNLLDQIHKCIQTKLFDDVQASLASAEDFKDQVGISCLKPGLEIIKAARGTEAVPGDPNANPPVPPVAAIEPGPILLFQKFREFELSGGPAACKTWVNSTIAGANPLTQ